MVLKTKLLRAILPCFFNSRSHHHPPQEPKKQACNQHSSTRRISLSDIISDPGSSLSVNDLSNSLIGSNLHIFTLAELKLITHDFSPTNFLGEGGFGPVYKGFVDDRTRPGLKAQPVAIKLLDLDGTQGYKEWLTEVIFLGQLRHSNLVKLIGYCCEDEHRLLVYEYIARGSLENQLLRRYSISLPWLTRIKIAVGAARGLAFLHGEEKPVIYRDFKTSNILLDSDYTAKLCDFGLAKDGPEGDDTHVTTRVMGTHGYAAPEYIMTGHLTTMSDVYSFGVVLLELLTGKRAMDKSRPSREQNLVEWARPLLKDFHKPDKIMDPKLDGQYSSEGARMAATLAYQCLSHHAKSRPTMNNVVKTLDNILDFKKDIPVGSVVYIVPKDATLKTKGHVKNEEEMTSSTNNRREEDKMEELKKNGNGCKRRRNGHRHKHPLRARAVCSDTALYTTLRKQLKSPKAKDIKGVHPERFQ
ncbi:hypothetical protein ACH5RR_024330 [Cinchona calisaya]|uniref:non-specific serine/threonine protein kinase n=1 Tax=Cinchona calisaya TaxID=153742 RepID=A0ABD2YXG4_9GENT